MKHPITVKFEDQILMFTVDIQRKEDTIVYHLEHDSNYEKFSNDLPEDFNIIRQDNSDQVTFRDEAKTDRGQALANAIWQVVESMAPQLKGTTEKAF